MNGGGAMDFGRNAASDTSDGCFGIPHRQLCGNIVCPLGIAIVSDSDPCQSIECINGA